MGEKWKQIGTITGAQMGDHNMHNAHHAADSLICTHAFSAERPILYVYREDDGFWTFTCGGTDHEDRRDVVPVCHDCALEEHGLTGAIGDLPPGFEASRDAVDANWKVRRSSD